MIWTLWVALTNPWLLATVRRPCVAGVTGLFDRTRKAVSGWARWVFNVARRRNAKC